MRNSRETENPDASGRAENAPNMGTECIKSGLMWLWSRGRDSNSGTEQKRAPVHGKTFFRSLPLKRPDSGTGKGRTSVFALYRIREEQKGAQAARMKEKRLESMTRTPLRISPLLIRRNSLCGKSKSVEQVVGPEENRTLNKVISGTSYQLTENV